jgi:FtsP/CotA-like multicopper oxidase with cupredoxin domain
MTFGFNRRQFLASALGVASGSLLPAAARNAFAEAPPSLIVERRSLDVKGKAASVFGIRQPNGTAGLALDPGQRFLVNVDNKTSEDTVLHWHGQTPPNAQDGVVETGSALIKAGSQQGYDFAPRAGTHWMHSHHGLQEQLLLAAPLVVRSDDDLRLDAQEVTVLLHDFTFRDPEELFKQVTGGAMDHGQMGQGGMAMPGMAMPGMKMPGMKMADGPMDLNDIDYDAYLANDRTLDDPVLVRTERSGRVRLRLINGATSTAFWIDLGAVSATILAVDGNPVRPITGRRFPLAQGQRIDLLVAMPAGGGAVPVLAQREGDRARTGIILATPDAPVARLGDQADAAAGPIDLSLEQRLGAATPLMGRTTNPTHRIVLGGTMMPYVWTIDGRTWTKHKPLNVTKGQRVVLEMTNRSGMAHPMHLHGHHFQLVALNGKAIAGAMRDTVLVPIKGTVTVAFDADNPGRWLLHCHNLLHMATGMMTELDYGRSA